MAAVTIAVANHESVSGEAKDEDQLLDNMRSRVPTKENRDAELYLRVLVLG